MTEEEMYAIIGKLYTQLFAASKQNQDLTRSMDKQTAEYQRMQQLYNDLKLKQEEKGSVKLDAGE